MLLSKNGRKKERSLKGGGKKGKRRDDSREIEMSRMSEDVQVNQSLIMRANSEVCLL